MLPKTLQEVFDDFADVPGPPDHPDHMYTSYDVLVPGFGYIRSMRKCNVSILGNAWDFQVHYVGRRDTEVMGPTTQCWIVT